MNCLLLTLITWQISISRITAIFAVSIVFFTGGIVQTVTTTVVYAVKTVCSVNTLCNRNKLFKMMYLKLFSPWAEVSKKRQIQNEQCQNTERNLLSICQTVNSGRTQHANGLQAQSERWTNRRRDEHLVQNNSEYITRQCLRKYRE